MTAVRRLLASAWLLPAAVAGWLVTAVVLRLSGSSTGELRKQLYGTQPDPQLLLGRPRAVRSDEWLVTTPLTRAQAEAGFPQVNPRLAGGTDVSFVYDAPYAGWPTAFRPHLWGSWLLDPERALALRWWLLPALLLLSTYALVLVLLPGRRLLAAAVGVGVLAAPFTQWWLSTAVATLAWTATACLAAVGLARSERARGVVLCAGGLAYSATALLLGVYPPFAVPAALCTAAWTAGHLLVRRREAGTRDAAVRAGAALAAGLAAAGVLGALLATRADVVRRIAGTDYPGERSVDAGGAPVERWLAGHLGPLLRRDDAVAPGALEALGGNQSEASGYLLLGLLALALPVWLLVRGRRSGRGADPVLAALLVPTALFLAHLHVPPATPLTRLVLLHLVPHERLQLGLGVLSTLLLVASAAELQRLGVRPSRQTALGAALAAGALLAVVSVRVHDAASALTAGLLPALLLAAGGAVLVGVLVRGRATAAAVGLAALGLASTWDVNPLHRGLFDVRETPLGQAVAAAQADDPGAWVSTLPPYGGALLVQAGVPTWSAPVAYPGDAPWDLLDPTGRDRPAWNRYAHVVFDPAAERTTAPQADVVVAPLDGCGAFTQARVAHVLSDRVLEDPCLRVREVVPLPRRTFVVHDVVRPG